MVRADRSEIEQAQLQMSQRFSTLLDERLSIARQQMDTLESYVALKAERHELESGLRAKLSTREFEEEMRGFARVDDVSTLVKQREHESSQRRRDRARQP